MTDQMPELSTSHPLHEDFDFLSFARKNEESIRNLQIDAVKIYLDEEIDFDKVSVLICAAICSDKTSIKASDLPLPIPSEEPYATRFLSFVENITIYASCLLFESSGLMKRNDIGFEATEEGKNFIKAREFGHRNNR